MVTASVGECDRAVLLTLADSDPGPPNNAAWSLRSPIWAGLGWDPLSATRGLVYFSLLECPAVEDGLSASVQGTDWNSFFVILLLTPWIDISFLYYQVQHENFGQKAILPCSLPTPNLACIF